MNQLELSFESNEVTLCSECLYDNECTKEQRIELNKNNIGCKKFILYDFPF